MDSESARGGSPRIMKLVIQDDEGGKRVVPFVGAELTLGRHESNNVPLPERNVSRRHARLIREKGELHLEDLNSANGVFLNGERVAATARVHEGDEIRIGDYHVSVVQEAPLFTPTPVETPAATYPLPPLAHPPPPPSPSLHAQIPTLLEFEALTDPGARGAQPRLSPSPPPPPPESHRITSIIQMTPSGPVTLGIPQAIDPADAPRLLVQSEPFVGREFACIRTVLRIGRSDEDSNDIGLDHRSLSRSHAMLLRGATGDWRVMDLGAANGILVNGERYSDATLSHGDILTLGHVRMKFLLAGEGVREQSTGKRKPRAARRWVGAAVLLMIVASVAGALYFQPDLVQRIASLGARPDAVVVQLSSSPPPPVVVAPAPLTLARGALERGDFSSASALLSDVKPADPSTQNAVAALRTTAENETAVQTHLLEAQQALNNGKPTEARHLLDGVETQYQSIRLAELQKKLAAMEALPQPTARPEPPPGALALFEQGKERLRSSDYAHAKELLERCLKLDPRFLHCEAFLGASYIGLGQGDLGLVHYRHFAEQAPESDPDYAAELKSVRQRLSKFDQELRRHSKDPAHGARPKTP